MVLSEWQNENAQIYRPVGSMPAGTKVAFVKLCCHASCSVKDYDVSLCNARAVDREKTKKTTQLGGRLGSMLGKIPASFSFFVVVVCSFLLSSFPAFKALIMDLHLWRVANALSAHRYCLAFSMRPSLLPLCGLACLDFFVMIQ